MRYDPDTDYITGCWLRLDRAGLVVLDADGDIHHRITEDEYRRLDADDRCCDWSEHDGVTGDCDPDSEIIPWCADLLERWSLPQTAVYEMYAATLPGWILGYTPDDEYERRRQEREDAEYHRAMDDEMAIHDRYELELQAIERGETPIYCEAETLEAAADEIGMPADSQTARLYYERLIHRAEAERRAAKISHRHEDTDYDAMLGAGMDRDTARDLIR